MEKFKKRWEFVDGDTVRVDGRVLTRIRALIDDPLFRFKAGDLGGYVEREENLPQNENGWVGGNAQAYGHSRIGGKARVYGNARVGEDALIGGAVRIGGNSTITAGTIE